MLVEASYGAFICCFLLKKGDVLKKCNGFITME